MLVVLQKRGYDVIDTIEITDPANSKTKRFLVNGEDEEVDLYCDIKKDPRTKHKDGKQVNYQEVDILQKMDHKNIIKFVDSFKDGEKILFIVTKAPKYKDIYNFLNTSDATEIREGTIRGVSYQVLDALTYLHGLGIAHNNITPASLGVQSITHAAKHLEVDIVLMNFVNACDEDKIHDTKTNGNVLFYAPEKFDDKTSAKSDIWSVGITIFELTYGYTPWEGNNYDEVKENVLGNKFDKDKEDDAHGPWFPTHKYIGQRGKNMLCRALMHDVNVRPTAKELMGYAWFDKLRDPPPPSPADLNSDNLNKGSKDDAPEKAMPKPIDDQKVGNDNQNDENKADESNKAAVKSGGCCGCMSSG